MITKLSRRGRKLINKEKGDRVVADLSGYELTHKKITDSGKANFLNDGYERANLRKICKDAGVTTGAFYRHFEDKEDLFVALVEPLANEILEFYSKFETESFLIEMLSSLSLKFRSIPFLASVAAIGLYNATKLGNSFFALLFIQD